MTENSFYQCWLEADVLGLLHVQHSEGLSIADKIDEHYKHWLSNASRNDEPISVDEFTKWLEIEYDGKLIANRIYVENLTDGN